MGLIVHISGVCVCIKRVSVCVVECKLCLCIKGFFRGQESDRAPSRRRREVDLIGGVVGCPLQGTMWRQREEDMPTGSGVTEGKAWLNGI